MTRREATRCTRQLLKGKIPMPKIPRGASAKQELGTLRRWIREMGAARRAPEATRRRIDSLRNLNLG
jgi:hypothetical protein